MKNEYKNKAKTGEPETQKTYQQMMRDARMPEKKKKEKKKIKK